MSAEQTGLPDYGLATSLQLHHVGIQTNDLANSIAWYQAYFGCEQQWSLSQFSDLTLSRLPGIAELTELRVGTVRFHLFNRPGKPADPHQSSAGYQHVCMSVARTEDLEALRERWMQLRDSGRFTFEIDEPPTDVVIDADGVHSVYLFDVNGVEFEFTYDPAPGSGPYA